MLYTGFLVFARLSTGLFLAPVFRAVPMMPRLAVAGTLTMVITPTLAATPWPPDLGPMVYALMGELMVGLLIGVFASVCFGVFQLGAEVGAQQIGYASAVQFDPTQGAATTAMSTMVALLAGALFLGMDLHLLMISGIAHSMQTAAPGQLIHPFASAEPLAPLIGSVLEAGLALASPLIAFALMLQGCFALVMKIAPSMNVFFSVGYGLLLLGGTGLMIVDLPHMLDSGIQFVHAAVEEIPTIVELGR